MTRGKHSQSSAHRATARVVEAEDKAREAQIQANRLRGVIADRDAEIHRLKEAVTQARIESTTPGTYTEAYVAQLRSDLERDHRDAIRAGFGFLKEHGADAVIPAGNIAGMATAFNCEPSDFVANSNPNRAMKRLTTSHVRLADEVMKREIA